MRHRRTYRTRERRQRLEPAPWGGFYPPVPWGGGVVYGLEGGGPAPFEPIGAHPYGDEYVYMPRGRRPSRGRGRHRAPRRARRRRAYAYGYDMGRPSRRHPRRRWSEGHRG
ncbi:MAG TPA: hypothetical protein VF188_14785 [Longimicrobiales bacterium]